MNRRNERERRIMIKPMKIWLTAAPLVETVITASE